jgi:aryl-alcohol dehydrogenase-like predicted oxidoreductase
VTVSASAAEVGDSSPPLVIGCEPLGGVDWGDYDLVEVRSAVAYAFERGLSAFDTADVYGLGRSEEQLARALGRARHSAYIVTKGGVRWDGLSGRGRVRTYRDASPAYLEQALTGSLRRLKLETIPLYLVHWPDGVTPVEAVLEALKKLQERGLILNYGLSNFSLPDVESAVAFGQVAAFQGPYSLIQRSARNTFCCAASGGLTTFAYGPLAQGLLTGKYARGSKFADGDRRNRLRAFNQLDWDRFSLLVQRMTEVGRSRGRSLSDIALRWVLDQPCVHRAVVGVKTVDQVDANLRSLEWRMAGKESRYLEDAASVIQMDAEQ